MALKKFLRIDGARVKLEKDLEHARVALKNTELEVSSLHRQIDEEKKATAASIREKDRLGKVISDLKEKLKRAHHGTTALELARRKIEAQLDETEQAANEMKNKIHRIEIERDKLNQDSQQLAQKVGGRVFIDEYSWTTINDLRKEINFTKLI